MSLHDGCSLCLWACVVVILGVRGVPGSVAWKKKKKTLCVENP